jgi:hypothetical protein
MKQDPLLRLRGKVRATGLQESNTQKYKLAKPAGNSWSASAMGWWTHWFPRDKTVQGNPTDSTSVLNRDYVIESLSKNDQVIDLISNLASPANI